VGVVVINPSLQDKYVVAPADPEDPSDDLDTSESCSPSKRPLLAHGPSPLALIRRPGDFSHPSTDRTPPRGAQFIGVRETAPVSS